MIYSLLHLIRQTKTKRILTAVFVVLIVLMHVLIWNFSGQDAATSSEVSGSVSQIIVTVVNEVTRHTLSDALLVQMKEVIEFPVRKLAHFTEYFILSVLVFGLWRIHYKPRKLLYFLNILFIFLSASSDELHQIFIPGRTAMFLDVLIDTSGGVIGLLLISLLVRKLLKSEQMNANFEENTV